MCQYCLFSRRNGNFKIFFQYLSLMSSILMLFYCNQLYNIYNLSVLLYFSFGEKCILKLLIYCGNIKHKLI